MDGKIFVLIIIVLVFTFGAFERWQKSKLSVEKARKSGQDDDTKREIEDLRERVETLERIVTDKGTRLSDEIDAL